MQTQFPEARLQEPGMARANKILRSCVHCGFCTATCPSYQVLGDELDSPRGRIYLIKEMLEQNRPADARVARHIDRCLGCLSCMTTCPSGVNYAHLIDMAREHVNDTYRRPLAERLLRGLLVRLLPYPGRFRLALLAGKIARPLRRLIPDARLRAMLEMVPSRIAPPSRLDDPQTHPAEGPRLRRLALLTGCAQKALNSDINAASIRLLRRLGCEVVIPEGIGCCGALAQHMGEGARARASAAALIGAVLRAEKEGAFDAVVINTSGCGTSVKDYGHLFADDPALAADAARVAGLAKDITEVLAGLDLPEGGAPDLAVAYHAACSLQHGQKIRATPKDLLKRAGYRVSEPADSHLCCGSAGTYNLLQPAISAELKRRKVANLEARAPQVIAAGNIGCMMQIGGGTPVPVVHTAELLDWAWGGPAPRALEKSGTAPD